MDKLREYNVKHPWHIGDTYVTSNSDGQISYTQTFYPDKNCNKHMYYNYDYYDDDDYYYY